MHLTLAPCCTCISFSWDVAGCDHRPGANLLLHCSIRKSSSPAPLSPSFLPLYSPFPPPQVLPRPLLEEFHRRFLPAPQLPDLAHHPHANFVVQAALAAAPTKEMVRAGVCVRCVY